MIFGCAGTRLGADERALFRDAGPLGFILFARNAEDPDQLRRLVDDLRAAVGRHDAPVLIDQEGGRVQRLGPPHWREYPPAGMFWAMAERNLMATREAVRLNHYLIAEDLAALGIDVNCVPVLDVPAPGADAIIGDRAAGNTPAMAAGLGRAAAEGARMGHVLPVIKHVPGHGRAGADSHLALPRIDTSRDDLTAVDFWPFAQLADLPMAMTAHVVYAAYDDAGPATTSATVIADVVRGLIGFDGLLLSDDLSMKALSGGLDARAAAAIDAGCDVVLHCNGEIAEMQAVAGAVGPLTAKGADRFAGARAWLTEGGDALITRAEAEARLKRLLNLWT